MARALKNWVQATRSWPCVGGEEILGIWGTGGDVSPGFYSTASGRRASPPGYDVLGNHGEIILLTHGPSFVADRQTSWMFGDL